MTSILRARYRYCKHAVLQHNGEKTYKDQYDELSALLNTIMFKLAWRDLRRLGYWSIPHTADAVVKLFQDAIRQSKNPAAMYWLANCGVAHVEGTRRMFFSDLYDAAAKQGCIYAKVAASDLYSHKHLTIEEMKELIRQYEGEAFRHTAQTSV